MRFLVDESTGTAVAQYLRGQGHEVVVVSEVMPQAQDVEILHKAVDEELIVITNDKDFGDLVYRSGEGHAGILLLRLRDESAANRVHVVKTVLETHGDAVVGNFVVATESHTRIRKTTK